MNYKINKRIPTKSFLILVILCIFILPSCKLLYMFYTPSIETLKKSALKGDVDAQKILSFKYYYGESVEKNYEESFKWIKMTDGGNDPFAIYFLAEHYHYGNGVEKNYKASYLLYQKSALLNFDLAQVALVSCLYYGHGVDIDYVESAAWYEIAKKNYDKKTRVMPLQRLNYDNSQEFNDKVNLRVKFLKKSINK